MNADSFIEHLMCPKYETADCAMASGSIIYEATWIRQGGTGLWRPRQQIKILESCFIKNVFCPKGAKMQYNQKTQQYYIVEK